MEIGGNADSNVYGESPNLHLSVTLKEAVSEKGIVLSHDFVRKEDGSAWVLDKRRSSSIRSQSIADVLAKLTSEGRMVNKGDECFSRFGS